MRTKLFLLFIPVLLMSRAGTAADILSTDAAIANVQSTCGELSKKFKSMRGTAQINTVITGVGTAAGAGALIAGLTKAQLDARLEEVKDDMPTGAQQTGMTRTDGQTFKTNVLAQVKSKSGQPQSSDTSKDEKKSKTLGNVRTGLLAGNTATNIAGTIIAASNRTNQDFRSQIENCKRAITDLQASRMQARADGADNATLTKIDNIISACREYETLDVSKIDSKATGAAISSGIGAGVGLAGTITSASANSKSVREADSDKGKAKEKNLNNASNILAGGATVASGVATVFNATQIKAIKQAYDIADKCEEALK